MTKTATTETVQFLRTPDGGELAVMSSAHYRALVDAAREGARIDEDAADAAAVHDLVANRPATLPLAVWDAMDSGQTPLRAIREWRGLRGVEVARRAGLSQSSYSRLESGGREPTPREIARLAQILDVGPDAFIPDLDED